MESYAFYMKKKQLSPYFLFFLIQHILISTDTQSNPTSPTQHVPIQALTCTAPTDKMSKIGKLAFYSTVLPVNPES